MGLASRKDDFLHGNYCACTAIGFMENAWKWTQGARFYLKGALIHAAVEQMLWNSLCVCVCLCAESDRSHGEGPEIMRKWLPPFMQRTVSPARRDPSLEIKGRLEGRENGGWRRGNGTERYSTPIFATVNFSYSQALDTTTPAKHA